MEAMLERITAARAAVRETYGKIAKNNEADKALAAKAAAFAAMGLQVHLCGDVKVG